MGVIFIASLENGLDSEISVILSSAFSSPARAFFKSLCRKAMALDSTLEDYHTQAILKLLATLKANVCKLRLKQYLTSLSSRALSFSKGSCGQPVNSSTPCSSTSLSLAAEMASASFNTHFCR